MLAIWLVINMKKRIFYSITGVTLISICVCNIFITAIMYNQLFSQAQKSIKDETQYLKKLLLSRKNIDTTDIFSSRNRITIIDTNGLVVFDNLKDPLKMDNHLSRPEIIALQSKNEGESTRLSDTFGEQTYYYAVALNDTYIVRLAITINSIYAMIIDTIPYMLIISLFVVIASMFISKYLTKKIIAPLYDIHEQTYDELDLFYKKINKQQEFILKQKNNLRQKTEEFNVITQNIADGFILLNANGEILTINQKAINILGITTKDYISKNIIELNRSEELIIAINKVFTGKNSEITLNIKNKHYILYISPIHTDESVKGAVILVIDTTEKVNTEKIRREFSANVSHELKTPLTSILGYAELIMQGLVKAEDIQSFSGKIYDEAQILLAIIEDILKISKIDECHRVQEQEIVNITELLENTISRLSILAHQKNIEFTKNLDSIEIVGVKSILDETFYNILNNAIKYNVQNGKISIHAYKNTDEIIISVSDTGIGIPTENIERVFERFYRVDTSHSKNITGTGLGLSIVKHAINLHGGKIYIQSEVDKGTTLEIHIPQAES